MIPLVVEHHPYRALPDLGCKLVRRLAHIDSTFSGVGASDKPGAVQIEIALGIVLTLGLFTRIAAFVSSGEMAAAYFMGHVPHGFWPGINGGSEAILYCFVFLYLSFAGAGAWSIDALPGVPSSSEQIRG